MECSGRDTSQHDIKTNPVMSLAGDDDDELVRKAAGFVETYMQNYDGSHDFNHIKRVVGLAQQILAEMPSSASFPSSLVGIKAPNARIVTLAALLHDVGDRKYIKPGEDASTMIAQLLRSFGADAELADYVQAICLGVSYSSEIRDPGRVQDLVEKYPELAVVQDADRLDAIGAVGIGRCFTFGGARTGRLMDETMAHFEEKLLRIEGMMKTQAGRALARERTERLALFRKWWDEETKVAGSAGL